MSERECGANPRSARKRATSPLPEALGPVNPMQILGLDPAAPGARDILLLGLLRRLVLLPAVEGVCRSRLLAGRPSGHSLLVAWAPAPGTDIRLDSRAPIFLAGGSDSIGSDYVR